MIGGTGFANLPSSGHIRPMLHPYLSLKLRRLAMATMLTVVYVHACNLDDRYLWAGRIFSEPPTFNNFFQVFLTLGVFRFGIPLFFLRSGYLMAETEAKYTPATRIKKRLTTLLLPYLLWSFFGLAVAWLFELHPVGKNLVDGSYLRPLGPVTMHQMSLENWIECLLFHPISFQLWFLRSLFIYSMLYPVFTWILARYPKIHLTLLTVAWLLSINLFVVEAEGLLAFSLGIWFHKNHHSALENTQWIDKLRLFWWLPVWVVAKTWLSFQPLEWASTATYFMHKISQPFLVLAVWRGYDLLFAQNARPAWIDGLSRYNFFVYGFHVPILYFATDFCLATLGRTENNKLLVFVFLPLAIVLMAIAMGKAVRMLSKPVFKAFTGGRE